LACFAFGREQVKTLQGEYMDETTQGAWLLAQSKSLDAVIGAGRLENIQYAGRAGRLYNLLRRNVAGESSQSLSAADVQRICQLNGIDRSVRESGLRILQDEGRIDVTTSGAVDVLGATTKSVLETTSRIFESSEPSSEERAVLQLSEKVAEKPTARQDIATYISDEFSLSSGQASDLIDVCRSTAIVDQAADMGLEILFNNNTFRDGQYAQKAYRLTQGLSSAEQARVNQVQEMVKMRGALLDADAEKPRS
jgi:hypothetical protein